MEAREIYTAIKEDNLKMFSSIFSSAENLGISLGRFPLLSLLYMYGAYQILDKFEQPLLQVRKYTTLEEPYEVYRDFRRVAKKSLKFFVDTDRVVEPAEMLAILDDRDTLKRNYKKLYRTEEVVQIVNEIYRINHGERTNITTGQFNLRRRKSSFLEKCTLLLLSLMLFVTAVVGALSVSLVVAKSGTGTAAHPFHISTEQELVGAIAKNSSNIILDNDIVLTKSVEPQNFSGVIDGNGKTISAGNHISKGLFAEFSGMLKNLKINAMVDGETYTDSMGIIAATSTGTIQDVVVDAKVDAEIKSDYQLTHEQDEEVPAIYISAFVVENNGEIKNSEAKVKADLSNKGESDAYFSAFAGQNNGTISNCKTSGRGDSGSYDISTDTVDVAGIVNENGNVVEDCTNNLSIRQHTSKEWNPMIAGIVSENYGKISGCVNAAGAKLDCVSVLDETSTETSYVLMIGGIVARNNYLVENCKNLAPITASATNLLVYVGGISAHNSYFVGTSGTVSRLYFPSVQKSLAKCNISVTGQKQDVYIGGVTAINDLGTLQGCGFEGEVQTTTTKDAYIGGIACVNYFDRLLYGFSHLHSYIQSCYTQMSVGDTEGITGSKHIGYIFSYFETAYYDNREDFEYGDIGALYDNHYIKTDENFAVGEVKYLTDLSAYGYGAIEDDYDGSTQIQSLEDLPEGRRIDA